MNLVNHAFRRNTTRRRKKKQESEELKRKDGARERKRDFRNGTSRSASCLVLDDVDLVDESELFEHCEKLSFGHVLRHLTYEQLHALFALFFLLFTLRHYSLHFSLSHTLSLSLCSSVSSLSLSCKLLSLCTAFLSLSFSSSFFSLYSFCF